MTGSLGLPKNDMGADNSIEQACAPDSKQMRLLGYSIADMAGKPVGIVKGLYCCRPGQQQHTHRTNERTGRLFCRHMAGLSVCMSVRPSVCYDGALRPNLTVRDRQIVAMGSRRRTQNPDTNLTLDDLEEVISRSRK
jgi:hypothetical protein